VHLRGPACTDVVEFILSRKAKTRTRALTKKLLLKLLLKNLICSFDDSFSRNKPRKKSPLLEVFSRLAMFLMSIVARNKLTLLLESGFRV
jgi:hypothetical protein